jgi:prepilin-type N-terminal cleavage/methylation domain-containing protein
MISAPSRRIVPLREKGFTLIEMLLTVAVLGVVILAGVQLISPMFKFFQRSHARQQANLEVRVCLETINRVLSNGRASTMVIATPSTTPTVQLSSATFQSMDGSTYTIMWSASPMNTVHLQKTPPGGSTTDTVLATNVTGLNFGFDVQDPGILHVSLTMTVPLDSSGTPDSFATILIPPLTVRMNAS